MPAELLTLTEQLENLQVLYLSALKELKPEEELARLRAAIIDLQDRIIQRKNMLKEKS